MPKAVRIFDSVAIDARLLRQANIQFRFFLPSSAACELFKRQDADVNPFEDAHRLSGIDEFETKYRSTLEQKKMALGIFVAKSLQNLGIIVRIPMFAIIAC